MEHSMNADAMRRHSTGRNAAVLALLLVLCLAAGGLGALATEPNIPTWYAGLNKPPFNPPNAVFPVVWTILYVLMAIAAWLAWRSAPTGKHWRVTGPFAVQLALNSAWSFAFFAAHNPWLGVGVIACLLVAILWTMLAFARHSRAAAALLVPYLAWVGFATALNVSIAVLN
jgi:tryptophan-rich sensory protein